MMMDKVPPLNWKTELTVLSLGAGVQSTALLVCSAEGHHDVPKADVAIFADTGDEPAYVYRHVERLRDWSPIPIEVVSHGCLSEDVLEKRDGKRADRFASIPAFTEGEDGRAVMLRRQCTREYKIKPIEKHIRRLLGYMPGQPIRGLCVEQLIGISTDEVGRAKPSLRPWIRNRWPLIEANLRRVDCSRIIREAGLPDPGKSACVYCPFHSDEYYLQLQREHPEDFQRAVEFDAAIRRMSEQGVKRPLYIHRSLRPLGEVDFTKGGQGEFAFMNECEGMCGV